MDDALLDVVTETDEVLFLLSRNVDTLPVSFCGVLT